MDGALGTQESRLWRKREKSDGESPGRAVAYCIVCLGLGPAVKWKER